MSKRVTILGDGITAAGAAIHLARHFRIKWVSHPRRPADRPFIFDDNSSILTLPFVMMDLFACAGIDVRDHIQIKRIDPATRFHWPDGSTFDLPVAEDDLRQELARLAPADVSGWLRILHHGRRAFERLSEQDDASSSSSRAWTWLRSLPPIRQMSAAPDFDRLIGRNIQSPKLRQVLSHFQSQAAPDPAALLWIEQYFGVWQIDGGFERLAGELRAIATKLDVVQAEWPADDPFPIDSTEITLEASDPPQPDYRLFAFGGEGVFPKLAVRNVLFADEPINAEFTPRGSDVIVMKATNPSRERLLDQIEGFECLKGFRERIVTEQIIEPASRTNIFSSNSNAPVYRLDAGKPRWPGIAGQVLAGREASLQILKENP